MKLLIAVKSNVIADALFVALSEHDIHICHTGTDAISLLDKLRPDLLIIDLMLSEIDGISVLQKIHSKPSVTLALTPLISESIIGAAVEAGIQDIILIPCTIRHVVECINTLIGKSPSTET